MFPFSDPVYLTTTGSRLLPVPDVAKHVHLCTPSNWSLPAAAPGRGPRGPGTDSTQPIPGTHAHRLIPRGRPAGQLPSLPSVPLRPSAGRTARAAARRHRVIRDPVDPAAGPSIQYQPCGARSVAKTAPRRQMVTGWGLRRAAPSRAVPSRVEPGRAGRDGSGRAQRHTPRLTGRV